MVFYKGHKHSLKTRLKIGKSNKGKLPNIKNPNWKGGVYLSRGWRFIYKPNYKSSNKQGYILEHRFIIEQYLGRRLSPKDIIHHIDGNKLNNKIENLILLNRSTHAYTHFPKGSRFGINQV